MLASYRSIEGSLPSSQMLSCNVVFVSRMDAPETLSHADVLAVVKSLCGMRKSNVASKRSTDHGVVQTGLLLDLVFQQRLASANDAGNNWLLLLVCDNEDGAQRPSL